MNSPQVPNHEGQSFWLDNLTRAMLIDGKLKRRVEQDGMSGVTSNPTTFSKSLTAGGAYDAQISAAARAGRSAAEIYDEISTQDVRAACDVLAQTFERSKRADGFVSLEVSPHLAHDTQCSIDEGLRLARMVDRPNLMIKIPGTVEGLSAIEELLYRGINVNITLLFSVPRYRDVFDRYQRALERRLEEGKSLTEIASVASFFLSRIDTLVDQLLDHRVRLDGTSSFTPHPHSLRGKTGIASAKLAHLAFRQRIKLSSWDKLTAVGARPQQLLWASTGTKNEHYSDVMYVEPLIGPMTINTLPEKTFDAFADHGKIAPTIRRGVNEASRTMRDLRSLGIDIKQVAGRLEDEGIEKFIESYDQSIAAIEEKRARFAERPVEAA